jgi:hypothetical protein
MKAYADLAKEAGFSKAAENVEYDYALAKKLLVAYADYQVVTSEQMEKFQARLKKETLQKLDKYTEVYKKLKLEPIQTYATMPPMEVLDLVSKAKATGLFGSFEVGYITDHVERRDPDPIVFGKIEGCGDYFFIAQWGDDVKVTDILAEEK